MNDCFKNLEKQLEIFKKHDGKINLGLVACEAHLVDYQETIKKNLLLSMMILY